MTYAIYFELYDAEGEVTQGLFIPYFKLVSRQYYPTIWLRSVSPDTPSRSWKSASNSTYHLTSPLPGEESDDVLAKAALGMEQLSGISSHMRGVLSSSSLTLRGSIPVYMTNANKLELIEKDSRLPVDLVTSIRLARNLQSWPNLPSPLRVGAV